MKVNTILGLQITKIFKLIFRSQASIKGAKKDKETLLVTSLNFKITLLSLSWYLLLIDLLAQKADVRFHRFIHKATKQVTQCNPLNFWQPFEYTHPTPWLLMYVYMHMHTHRMYRLSQNQYQCDGIGISVTTYLPKFRYNAIFVKRWRKSRFTVRNPSSDIVRGPYVEARKTNVNV